MIKQSMHRCNYPSEDNGRLRKDRRPDVLYWPFALLGLWRDDLRLPYPRRALLAQAYFRFRFAEGHDEDLWSEQQ